MAQVLSTVAEKQGTMFDLIDDPAVWSAVNGEDPDFTAEERDMVRRRLGRHQPQPPAATRTALAHSLDYEQDSEVLRESLLAEYQRYRSEACGITERFELMRKFLSGSDAEPGVPDKLTKQIIDEYHKCKPRLVELRDMAAKCRARIARLP